MTKQKRAVGGRPKNNRQTVSIRFDPEVLTRVRAANRVTGNLSHWIEQACLFRLEHEPIYVERT